MEKICLENIVSGLMVLGFDKVDSLLLGYTTEEILKSDLYRFKLEDYQISSLYKYVDYSDGVFKFKENENINSNIVLKDNSEMSLRTMLALHSNKKVLEVLKTIDFKEIILKKISVIGIKNMESMNHLFSNKEKNIIMNVFGIELNNSKDNRK